MKKKIEKKFDYSIVGIVGIPSNYGGFETFAEHLVRNINLKKRGLVFCQNSKFGFFNKFYNTELFGIPLKANGVTSIIYDFISIIYASKLSKNIIVLGTPPAIFIPILKLFFKVNFIINVDGIEWKRNKWSLPAKYFLKLTEYLAACYADVIISDNVQIKKYIDNRYQINSIFISYGGDHILDKKDFNSTDNFFLTIARIEPENNIHIILDTFYGLNENLIIIGNWDNSIYGKNLYNKYNNEKNIKLLNPIYEKNKLNPYRFSCKSYIHPHSAGGSNPSLIEAMFTKKNILSFDCSFNRSTTNNLSYYWKNSSDLKKLILDKKNNKNSKVLYDYASKNYSWKRITEKYYDLIL